MPQDLCWTGSESDVSYEPDAPPSPTIGDDDSIVVRYAVVPDDGDAFAGMLVGAGIVVLLLALIYALLEKKIFESIPTDIKNQITATSGLTVLEKQFPSGRLYDDAHIPVSLGIAGACLATLTSSRAYTGLHPRQKCHRLNRRHSRHWFQIPPLSGVQRIQMVETHVMAYS